MKARPGSGIRGDRGSVTAELAAALPALVLLLMVGLAAVSAVEVKLRCLGAARDAALAQARGADGAAVGRASAPDGATINIAGDSEVVRVVVSAQVRPFGRVLPGVVVRAAATAAVEAGEP
jgi:hypothetical protein